MSWSSERENRFIFVLELQREQEELEQIMKFCIIQPVLMSELNSRKHK